MRAGGGIGDQIPKITFDDKGYYFTSVFYNLGYYIVIIMILGNIILGLIVDTFAELRDSKNQFDYDTYNVCFICQLDRDTSLQKFIDFNKHMHEDHLLWNYVAFICFLKLTNSYDFTHLEYLAYHKLNSLDITWIPLNKIKDE
jgi:hypothetical protein